MTLHGGPQQDRMDAAFRLARDPANAGLLRRWIESERGTRFGLAYCAAFQSLSETVDRVEQESRSRVQQVLAI